VEAQPLARLPEHRHENEQVGLLVRGQLTFTIAGRETTVRGGDGWVIPGDVLHGAVAGPDGALVIETWGPPREDFRQLPPAAPGAARWPT